LDAQSGPEAPSSSDSPGEAEAPGNKEPERDEPPEPARRSEATQTELGQPDESVTAGVSGEDEHNEQAEFAALLPKRSRWRTAVVVAVLAVLGVAAWFAPEYAYPTLNAEPEPAPYPRSLEGDPWDLIRTYRIGTGDVVLSGVRLRAGGSPKVTLASVDEPQSAFGSQYVEALKLRGSWVLDKAQAETLEAILTSPEVEDSAADSPDQVIEMLNGLGAALEPETELPAAIRPGEFAWLVLVWEAPPAPCLTRKTDPDVYHRQTSFTLKLRLRGIGPIFRTEDFADSVNPLTCFEDLEEPEDPAKDRTNDPANGSTKDPTKDPAKNSKEDPAKEPSEKPAKGPEQQDDPGKEQGNPQGSPGTGKDKDSDLGEPPIPPGPASFGGSSPQSG
jgi:hypothetical protein